MSRTQIEPTLERRSAERPRQTSPSSQAFLVVVLAFLADRVFKWIALLSWSVTPVEPLPGVRLILFLNPGIAFSMPLPSWLFFLLALPVLAALAWLFRIAVIERRGRTAAGLLVIIAGAISNIADRLLYGGVIDFFQIDRLPVVNVADVMIVAGVVVLILKRGKGE